jgi:hypothetical protein
VVGRFQRIDSSGLLAPHLLVRAFSVEMILTLIASNNGRIFMKKKTKNDNRKKQKNKTDHGNRTAVAKVVWIPSS